MIDSVEALIKPLPQLLDEIQNVLDISRARRFIRLAILP